MKNLHPRVTALERTAAAAPRVNVYAACSDDELIALAHAIVAAPSGCPELDSISRVIAENHPAA